eukprot:TRINITY_DN27354_c0_g1_i1.p1 TRINITY_DN27354_c0_g1~~TRINITY_DN27354_c0_g1_i1.p1  ORF type:complete len:122 (+),score=24.10 TRINITY_DN27354_c0_g1_i1:163-528(+)
MVNKFKEEWQVLETVLNYDLEPIACKQTKLIDMKRGIANNEAKIAELNAKLHEYMVFKLSARQDFKKEAKKSKQDSKKEEKKGQNGGERRHDEDKTVSAKAGCICLASSCPPQRRPWSCCT